MSYSYKFSDYQVSGVLVNGEPFSVIVLASYGYAAMRNAEKKLGSKIKTYVAMKVANFPTAECAECGEDVPTPYQATHSCVSA